METYIVQFAILGFWSCITYGVCVIAVVWKRAAQAAITEALDSCASDIG